MRGRARVAVATPTAEAGGTPATPAAPVSLTAPAACAPVASAEPGSPKALRRSAWDRVLQNVFEVDPRLVPRCGSPVRIIAWITNPVDIGRILEHRKRSGRASPFDAREPPQDA